MAEAGGRKKGKRQRVGAVRGRKRSEPKWKAAVKEIEEVSSQYETLDATKVEKFSDIPMSSATGAGLKACGYTHPTDIQKAAIPLALRGRDVLGAAKTGSGKTLAFLIPLLELLWQERWGSEDGLGALVISPTRELAYQTFEVLRKVGRGHDFSAGLVTGGKDIQMEKNRIQQTNIVICTPGRLLQHMDETASFNCSSLKILVLDEADRILDLGFQHTVNAIIENLPATRQTLLFSATQTKSVRDLARLSLVHPEYVAVHEHSKHSTPHKLHQSYLRCELPDKLSVLYSFIRSHVACKIIVFISSCKQVKFVYEAFRQMRPGVPLMALYGRQKHLKRMAIYNDFCRKKASVLLCTDIAARGLDIPAVDWVVQLDCPEDANTYIHRVGRTARYEKGGKALLFLLPSEEKGMLEALEAKKIPIEESRVNPKKIVSIQSKLEAFCAQSLEMKQWAQRSFVCYLRSVHLQANKAVFDVHQLPLEEFAASLGLPKAPRVRFLQREARRRSKLRREGGKGEELSGESGSGQSDGSEGSQSEGEEEEEEGEESEAGSGDDQVLYVKRVIPVSGCGSTDPMTSQTERPPSSRGRPTKAISKVSSIKKILNKKIKLNSHVKFDEEGEELQVDTPTSSGRYKDLEDTNEDSDDCDDGSKPASSIAPIPVETFESLQKDGGGGEEREVVGGIKISDAQRRIRARDKIDRKFERERIRALHRERRAKRRRQAKPVDADSDEGDHATSGALLAMADSDADTANSTSSDEGPHQRPGGRKRRRKGEEGKTRPKRRATDEQQLGTSVDPELAEDEELARHLLGM